MNGSNAIPKELMDSLLLSIVSFMNQAGMSQVEIEKSFHIGMRELSSGLAGGKKNGHPRPSAIGCDTIAGAVLRAWHRDPDFLDDQANPTPLSISGRTRSLSSLVRAQDPNADVIALVNAMQRTGLIKRLGNHRYLYD